MAPFIVLALVDEYFLGVEYRWGNRAAAGVNLFKNWSKIYLQQEINFQRDFCDHCVKNEDIVSCECTLELFANSCSGALIKSIEKKYETLDELEQGGITYQKIEFYEMFNMINVVITYLHEFIRNFTKDRISNIKNKTFWI